MLLMLTQAVAGAVLGFTPPAEAPAKTECCCQAADDRVWLIIEKDRLVLSDEEWSESARAELSQDALVIGCGKFQSEAAAGRGATGIRVRCDDVQFLTSHGIRGRAAQLAYDSASRRLELRGSEGQPVRLAFDSESANEMNLVATEMQIDLKSSRFHLHGSGMLQGSTVWDVPVTAAGCSVTACAAGECDCCSRDHCCCTSNKAAQTCPLKTEATAEDCPFLPAHVLQFDVFRALR